MFFDDSTPIFASNWTFQAVEDYHTAFAEALAPGLGSGSWCVMYKSIPIRNPLENHRKMGNPLYGMDDLGHYVCFFPVRIF